MDSLMAYVLTSLFPTTIHLFYLLYSYHDLMVAKYGCKREKSQEAKRRSAEEWKPMQEMERAVDIDLFLEAQKQWPRTAHTASSYYMKCSCMPCPKDRRRQSELSTGAADSICPNWTLRWTHPLSSWCIWRLIENNC